MRASPIRYVREATLRGTLFDRQDHSGLVSGVDTGFFVDHEEPRQALERVRKCWHWPLGDLPEGHEYLLVLPGQPQGFHGFKHGRNRRVKRAGAMDDCRRKDEIGAT
ncbi:hypothetical protein VTK73DRAFT_4658 [Phialemonium thermophilum]|uniref:Uncharacterized protein n=1 Tax=Phialemonium thermophilum TaxID=223376 RepID=A0ABR3V8Y8_9PEZI